MPHKTLGWTFLGSEEQECFVSGLWSGGGAKKVLFPAHTVARVLGMSVRAPFPQGGMALACLAFVVGSHPALP